MESANHSNSEELISKLDGLGVVLRFSKTKKLLSIDARPSPSKLELGDDLIKQLPIFDRLKEVYLSDCPVTDAAVAHLASLKRLEILELDNTNVSDEMLPVAAAMNKLKILSLNQTLVTKEAVAQIRKKMLGCRIVFRG